MCGHRVVCLRRDVTQDLVAKVGHRLKDADT
jgi:hypothetical protein